MIALVGALGDFHLPQQGVHLGNGEAAARVNGGTAGQCTQKFVGGAIEMMSIRIEVQIVHDSLHNPGDVLSGNQRGYAT